jgi:hypothetical protein
MPNWCNNSIEIVGPRDKIRAIWAQAQKDEKDGGGFLQALYPMPLGLMAETAPAPDDIAERNRALYGASDWYSWRTNNWSTKWEVSLEGLEYEEDDDTYPTPYARISGWFDSAWAPPTGAMAHYGARNEDVKITLDYYESGMGFVGCYTIEQGLDDDDYYDIGGETSETVRDIIGEAMDDMWNISESMREYEEEQRLAESDEVSEWYNDGVEKLGLTPHRLGD